MKYPSRLLQLKIFGFCMKPFMSNNWKRTSLNQSYNVGCSDGPITLGYKKPNNVKTRKLGKYVADEHATLQVKGAGLQFYDEKQRCRIH